MTINDMPAFCYSKTVGKLTLKDFDKYDFIINVSALYATNASEMQNSALLLEKLYHRVGWKRILATIVREASSLYYSRLKLSDDQSMAKANFVYTIRESRHNSARAWSVVRVKLRTKKEKNGFICE